MSSLQRRRIPYRQALVILLGVALASGCGSSDVNSFLVNPNSPDDRITDEPGMPGGAAVLELDDAGIGDAAVQLIDQLPSSVGANTQVALSEDVQIIYPNGANSDRALQILVDPPIVIDGTGIGGLNLTRQELGCNDQVPTTCNIPAGAALIPRNAGIAANDYEFTYRFQSVDVSQRTVVRRFLTVR